MDSKRWHSEICLTLSLKNELKLEELEALLLSLGFESSDDRELYAYPRKDKIKNWQTESLLYLDTYIGENEVVFNHEEYDDYCDSIKLTYLLPWLPFVHFETFIETALRISKELETKLFFLNEELKVSELRAYAKECKEDLENRLEAPGGEFLAQAIEMDLPI